MGSKQRIPTERIIAALRQTNGLISLAAKLVPCSVTTIRQRARDVKEVQRVIDDCREELVDWGEYALRARVLAGDPWAVSLVLKTLGKNRGYVERVESTGADGGSIVVTYSKEAPGFGNPIDIAPAPPGSGSDFTDSEEI